MNELVFYALLILGAIFVVPAAAFFFLLNRIHNLKERVKILEGGKAIRPSAPARVATATPTATKAQFVKPKFVQSAPSPQPRPVGQPFKPASDPIGNKVIDWIKEDWLLKLGAALLLMGVGWFVTYAFINNWIGPMGRIGIGLVAGAAFLVLGWLRIRKYVQQGGIFLVLGSSTILLTLFAAREVYGFFTPVSALVVMFLSVVLVALASVKCNVKWLAFLSLVLAGLSPFFTDPVKPEYILWFSYIFVVVLGTVWVISIKGWRELTFASLVLVFIYSAPHLFGATNADREILMMFAFAFAALFFITNSMGILKAKGETIVPDLLTAACNGGFLLIWILSVAQEEWQSLIISAWMIVFGVGSWMLFKATGRREPFYVYAGVGIAMLVAATAVELDGYVLTLAYIAESFIIPLVAYAVLKEVEVAEKLSLLMIGPIILSLESLNSRLWRFSIPRDEFLVLASVALALMLFGVVFLTIRRKKGSNEAEHSWFFTSMWLIAGSIYIYVLIWLSSHASFINNDHAVLISLVTYTVIGLITYFHGEFNDNKIFKVYGGLLLGFVVGRLLLADVWRMRIAGRVVTFLSVGALLAGTAFIGRRHHDKISGGKK